MVAIVSIKIRIPWAENIFSLGWAQKETRVTPIYRNANK
jgi:hypothetical protein